MAKIKINKTKKLLFLIQNKKFSITKKVNYFHEYEAVYNLLNDNYFLRTISSSDSKIEQSMWDEYQQKPDMYFDAIVVYSSPTNWFGNVPSLYNLQFLTLISNATIPIIYLKSDAEHNLDESIFDRAKLEHFLPITDDIKNYLTSARKLQQLKHYQNDEEQEYKDTVLYNYGAWNKIQENTDDRSKFTLKDKNIHIISFTKNLHKTQWWLPEPNFHYLPLPILFYQYTYYDYPQTNKKYDLSFGSMMYKNKWREKEIHQIIQNVNSVFLHQKLTPSPYQVTNNITYDYQPEYVTKMFRGTVYQQRKTARNLSDDYETFKQKMASAKSTLIIAPHKYVNDAYLSRISEAAMMNTIPLFHPSMTQLLINLENETYCTDWGLLVVNKDDIQNKIDFFYQPPIHERIMLSLKYSLLKLKNQTELKFIDIIDTAIENSDTKEN